MRHVVNRFPSRQVADMVLAKLKTVVIGAHCSVSLEDDLSESDVKRGVGKWAIIFEFTSDIVIVSTTRWLMSNAVDYALQLALAEELQKLKPTHCLLDVWHLNPNNQPNRAKYNFTDSYSL
jgi:hypothetical protein